MNGQPGELLALTRGWFHGWCQCGSSRLWIRDTWPLLPTVTCDDCGRSYQSVLAPYYVRTDTENGRHYISYRPMDWPFYAPSDIAPRIQGRSVWARIIARRDITDVIDLTM